MFASGSFSPPKLQTGFSSLDSSPQPEKISLEDLTGLLSGSLNDGVNATTVMALCIFKFTVSVHLT